MKIRLATTKDLIQILKIGESAKEFKVSKEVINFWPKKILENCIKSKTNFLIVAEESKKIVGFIIINYNLTFKKAIIENIFVKDEFRKKEVAKKMLYLGISKIRKIGCEYICALVNKKDRKSVRFYLNSNFNKGITCIWLDKILGKSFHK